jgi:type VI secretion system FHA domain protein
MTLTFRILSYRNGPVPPAPQVRFGVEGGSIGRAPENALVLDDPTKYISRVHARVLARGDAFVLEDLGSNASVVNDRPLGKGSEVALAHGDRLAIGDYQLQVLVEQAPAHSAPLAPAPVNDTALPLFEPPAPPVPRQLPPLDLAPAPAAAASFFDPLAGTSLLDIDPGEQVAPGAADPLGLNLFAGAPTAPARAADSDHVSPELAAFMPPQPLATPAPIGGFAIPHDYDPLADFFAPPVVAPVAPPTQPPAITPVAAAPAPAVAVVAPLAADGDVLQALLRGLGLPNLKLDHPAAAAELAGALLREATAGTMDVLMARALTKKGSRIDMTMLAVRANNPLKFFPHVDGALTQMLTGAMAGYLAPVEAMAGAFDDLRAHELAVIAGMHAALGAVLHRFDPERIEARLAVPTVMDKMLASHRKAKLWDRLVELFDEIAREADDDLQRLFGEKFSQAYEEQVARLRQEKQ